MTFARIDAAALYNSVMRVPSFASGARSRVLRLLLVVGPLLLAPFAARATPDLPALHDARSVGMGGTGVAFASNASAVFHNPAALEQIENFSVTAVFSPLLGGAKAPLGADGSQLSTGLAFAPLFFVGGGVRLFDRFVVGAAVYTSSGFGATYEDVPLLGGQDLELQVAVIEAAVPVTVRIIDGLSVSVALRLAFAFQDATLAVPNPADPESGQLVPLEQNLNGFGHPGVQVGVFYQPIPALRLGVSYRSKITIDLDGEVVLPGQDPFDADSEYALAHSLRIGGAYTLLEDRLLLSGEFFMFLYDEANDSLPTMATVPNAPEGTPPIDLTVPLQWKNHYGGRVGGEYFVWSKLALRLGYVLANSAVPDETVGPFTTPPGLLHSVTAGVGWSVESFAFDLGGAVNFGSAEVEGTPINGSPPGAYDILTGILAFSASYTH